MHLLRSGGGKEIGHEQEGPAGGGDLGRWGAGGHLRHVDSGRWATLEPLIRRALGSGRAVVVADQGLDPLTDQLEDLAGKLDISLQRWPVQPADAARGWRDRSVTPPGRTAVGALLAFENLLWIDLPASGLDVAGFVEAVHGLRVARADEPVVVVAHDLAWRNDAGALMELWDAASTSEDRLCAILTAPGLPSETRLRSSLLEASLVGVHRVDSPVDAAILADYLNQPLKDGVEEHEITVNYRTNILPIGEFFLTLPDHHLPLVLVDATGRPDFVDLFRVAELDGEQPEIQVGWLVSPLSGQQRSIQMTCQVVRPVKAAYSLWFQAPEHTALLRRIATAGQFLLGVQPSEDIGAVNAWIMDGRLPSTVRATLDHW
jgi:hypothetical protein